MTKTILSSLLLLCSVFMSVSASAQDQAKKDDAILAAYFKKNKIKAEKTSTGLYYVIHKPGEGEKARKGQKVGMNYLGRFLDGKKFDGNIDEQYAPVAGRQVFVFTLGAGQVIAGWDEGVQLLNKGTRATLYLPSHLAYGPDGRPGIPPNSILMFDVEVMSVK
ncbi:MAG: FKBP-type peptidyl-prolyl cis-trans isomerase [Flavipsychrobacter sp.]|nr:FKBP-type peptidyl-prolyl cis-trans isomerase [Flavipsychrobacter sp.]